MHNSKRYKTMEELEIAILIADGCTKSEAEKLLKNGTTVYDDPQEWINNLIGCNVYEGETVERAEKGYYENISFIIYDRHQYLISYVV